MCRPGAARSRRWWRAPTSGWARSTCSPPRRWPPASFAARPCRTGNAPTSGSSSKPRWPINPLIAKSTLFRTIWAPAWRRPYRRSGASALFEDRGLPTLRLLHAGTHWRLETMTTEVRTRTKPALWVVQAAQLHLSLTVQGALHGIQRTYQGLADSNLKCNTLPIR